MGCFHQLMVCSRGCGKQTNIHYTNIYTHYGKQFQETRRESGLKSKQTKKNCNFTINREQHRETRPSGTCE